MSVATPAHAQARPHLPDFSAYNCTAIDSATAHSTQHMGQFIGGKYFEWDAIHVVDQAGARHLACISQLKPEAKQLSVDEAKAFLTASMKLNVPTRSAPMSAPLSAPAGDPRPANTKAEPLLRVTPGTVPPASAAELPPRAATRVVPQATASVPTPSASTANAPTTAMPWADIVTNTQEFPWNTVGEIETYWPGSEVYRCSGTLVSPYVVLTAGHCLVHAALNTPYTVTFYPGQTQGPFDVPQAVTPYGRKTDVANRQYTQAWAQIAGKESYPTSDFKHDFAAVQYATPFTFTSTFMPIIYSSTVSQVNTAGYPGKVNGALNYNLYSSYGTEITPADQLRANHVREFNIVGGPGSSGGPFFMIDPETGQYAIVGSLSFGDDAAGMSGGPWYDSWNQPLISSWVTWTPDTPRTGLVNGEINGARLQSVASGNGTTSQSFLRLFNAGWQTGTATVSFADPDSGFILGAWTSPVLAPNTELQMAVKDMEKAIAPAIGTRPAYTVVVNATFTAYVQHVIWQPVLNRLVNLSGCHSTYIPGTSLMAAHSSVLAGSFPSTIILHNTGAKFTTFTLGIYDARNGTLLGTYTSAKLMPNGQTAVTVADMEKAAGITPSGTMYHYVITGMDLIPSNELMLKHYVTAVSDGAVEDLTTTCSTAGF